jgi:hypothetical protein
MLAFRADYRPEWAEAVSRILANRINWSESARIQHLAEFELELANTLARF